MIVDGLRSLEEDERAIVDEVAALVERAGPAARRARAAGWLRLRSDAGEVDLLLGDASMVDAPVPILRWDAAPLARVFFEAGAGDAYEVEIDDRVLAGTVLRRCELTLDEGGLRRVATEDFDARRTGSGWTARDREPRAVPPRPAHLRGRRPSPLAVELDEAQRAAVERPRGESLLVLGDAGYGKTTVALHRVRHLQREAEAAGRRFRALVLVPTEGLRRLSTLALERLEVEGVEVVTFDEWIVEQGRRAFAGLPRRVSAHTRAGVISLKRHPAVRQVLPEIARGTEAMRDLGDSDPDAPARRTDLLHLFGDRKLVEAIVAAAGGAIPRPAVEETLAHTRLQFAKRTEDLLTTADRESVDERTDRHDVDSIDVEDFPVLFELSRLKTGIDAGSRGRLARYDHVVVDEAQELSALELAVIGRAVDAGGSITIAGDAKQSMDPTIGFLGWETAMNEAAPGGHLEVRLEQSYRCPPAVERLARSLFEDAPRRPEPDTATLVERFDAPLHVIAALLPLVERALRADRMLTAAVIVRSPAGARAVHERLAHAGLASHLALGGNVLFEPGLQVTCVDEIRGLEFDVVVVPDATPSAYPEEDPSRNSLYVATTRATHCLALWTIERWSPLLRWN